VWGFAAMALGFLGKQEWNVCLLIAASVTLIWGVLKERKRWPASLAVMALAAVTGMFLSWVFDPLNWSEGGEANASHLHCEQPYFGTISFGFVPSPVARTLFGHAGFRVARQAWLVPSPGMASRRIPLAFSLLFSMALMVPFLLSTWSSDYRYFAPALAAVSAGLVFEFSRWNGSGPAVQRFNLSWFRVRHWVLLSWCWCFATSRSVTERPMGSWRSRLLRIRTRF